MVVEKLKEAKNKLNVCKSKATEAPKRTTKPNNKDKTTLVDKPDNTYRKVTQEKEKGKKEEDKIEEYKDNSSKDKPEEDKTSNNNSSLFA